MSYNKNKKRKSFNVHLIRFLCSVGGTDKVLMTVQYASRIVFWHCMKTGNKSLAIRLKNLEEPIDDFRVLLRYYGLVPLVQWIVHVESNPPPSKLLLNINRMQNFVNVFYYPLEHTYWLGKHNLREWSCRLWAVYIILQFWNIWEEYKLLRQRENYVNSVEINDPKTEEELREKRSLKKVKHQLEKEKLTIVMNLIINTAYLPLTLSWSFKGLRISDAAEGSLGLTAALCQFFTSWVATS
ncbi:hypothetical protein PIROE2DRAFT_66086 [Piromyces sp. E2]|nr:hypothetical protein PIROE2DRAFT_66086 [Piromyces sp. E2]|eukprot:OUM66139.1 hypothetical protein PIROE2DRAFT_66086 [Piromyces sp. E2]